MTDAIFLIVAFLVGLFGARLLKRKPTAKPQGGRDEKPTDDLDDIEAEVADLPTGNVFRDLINKYSDRR